MSIPVDLTRKTFYKKSRKGKIIKVVNEKYIRTDLSVGLLRGSTISTDSLIDFVTNAPHKHILIVDTNIALHQIDFLEYNCPDISLIVILQTVLQELRNLNISVYKRLLTLLNDEKRSFIFYPNELSSETIVVKSAKETINDSNDKAIRKYCSYISRLINDKGSAILLTEDNRNRQLAQDEGLISYGIKEYVKTFLFNYPELLDLLFFNKSHDESSKKDIYDQYININSILPGLKSKKYIKGTIRCCNQNPNDCYVISHKSENEVKYSIKIQGHLRVNRAIDGDVVAVEIVDLPYIDDSSSSSSSSSSSCFDVDVNRPNALESSKAEAGIAEVTNEPNYETIEGIVEDNNVDAKFPTKKVINSSNKDLEATNKKSSSDCGQLHGRVIGIIKRNWRQYVGTISTDSCDNSNLSESAKNATKSDKNNTSSSLPDVSERDYDKEHVLVIPNDKKIPSIVIATRRKEELIGQRLLVTIDSWPPYSEYPFGHYISTIGKIGDKSVETQVLLHEFDVPHHSFSQAVLACLPPPDWKITQDVINEPGRVDLRDIPVVSIDPPGCKDIDDALHCISLPDGSYEVGVHIADVSYFVAPESPLDKEAAHRSTSTYLVERRLDMLPEFLTTRLCSLRSNEDHLAFSVIWIMDKDANIKDVRFHKSVIHSVASLTYDEAQTMIDSPSHVDRVNVSVCTLNHLAKIIRKRRIDEGALTLASPEVRFKLDLENDNPTDVQLYSLKESNSLVEEFMLLANITVSKKILRHYPSLSVLRRHQPPSREQFSPLVSAAASVGIVIDISSSKALADSLDAANLPGDPYFNKLLRILSTRCMMPAQYFCSGEIPKDQWHHYGLAAPIYTHFTSPIRRYPDILVHRLLASAIGAISLPANCSDRIKLQELCTHMNRRHKAAQYAQRASVSIHTLLFFHNRPVVECAYVLSVNISSISLLVPRYGIEGRISIQDYLSENFLTSNVEYDSIDHSIQITAETNNHQSQTFKLKVFQTVQVEIKVQSDSSGSKKLLINLFEIKNISNKKVRDDSSDSMNTKKKSKTNKI